VHKQTKERENFMSIEKQMDQLIEAVNSIELESSSTVDFGVDSYNLISSIWEELNEISKTLKRIADKQ